LNASSILEVSTALNETKTKIIELETDLKTKKYSISVEFLKTIEKKDKMNKEEIQITVQAIRDDLTS
jgi:hypothetical protein